MTGPQSSSGSPPPPPSGSPAPAPRTMRRDTFVAAICGLVVALMVGASYAAVPLYDWFCRATGFNGTTQRATAAPARQFAQTVTVRFDSNVNGLPWKFQPEKTEIEVHIGEVVTAYYTVTNESAHETHGLASYNVTPLAAGSYFQKINCFCFTEQTFAPGETREMAVVFYVDASLLEDNGRNAFNTITLSYTFYPAKETEPKPLAEVKSDRRGGSL